MQIAVTAKMRRPRKEERMFDLVYGANDLLGTKEGMDCYKKRCRLDDSTRRQIGGSWLDCE